MKQCLIALALLTGAAVAAPSPGSPAAGNIPDWLDTDGDGMISELERQTFADARRDAVAGLIEELDTSGDGIIDDDERDAAIAALKARAEQKLRNLFMAVAGDDGELTFDDFAAIPPVEHLPEELAQAIFIFLGGDDGVVTEEEFLDAIGGMTIPIPAFPIS